MVDLVAEGGGVLADDQYALIARLDSVKIFSQLLKSINFRESSTWFVSSDGIKVTVEDAKSVQTNAFVKADLFQEFTLQTGRGTDDRDELSFSVNLGVVLECLNMFGGVGSGGGEGGGLAPSPNLKLCYSGYGHPLVLLLEEGGVVTDCKIKTREAEECLDFNFANGHIVSKIIMNSEHFKDVMNELDPSCEYIQFRISPTEQSFLVNRVISKFTFSGMISNKFFFAS